MSGVWKAQMRDTMKGWCTACRMSLSERVCSSWPLLESTSFLRVFMAYTAPLSPPVRFMARNTLPKEPLPTTFSSSKSSMPMCWGRRSWAGICSSPGRALLLLLLLLLGPAEEEEEEAEEEAEAPALLALALLLLEPPEREPPLLELLPEEEEEPALPMGVSGAQEQEGMGVLEGDNVLSLRLTTRKSPIC